jgi:hypothetical protein
MQARELLHLLLIRETYTFEYVALKGFDEGTTPRSSIFAYLVPAKKEAHKAQHFDLE